MVFRIKETSETRETDFRDSNGVDLAAEIAKDIGLGEDDDIFYDDELDVYVASRETVECWYTYFKIFAANDRELMELKRKYDGYEVDDLCFTLQSSDYPDPYEIKDLLPIIRGTLEKRYNPKTARLIGEYHSVLPQDNSRYFKEALYQQNTGEFFLVGEGGAMSGYGMKMSDGSMGYGERSFSLTDGRAQAWVKNRLDQKISIDPF